MAFNSLRRKNNHIEESVVEVKSNLYRITYGWGLRPNTLLAIQKRGYLIVDPGQRPMCDLLKKAIKRLTKEPLRYILNTHPHGDHVGANQDFINNKVTLISIETLTHPFEKEQFIKRDNPLLNSVHQSCYEFEFEEMRVQLLPFPGIHSSFDMLVYFVDQGVLHCGDLLLTESFPAIGFRVKEYVHFLNCLIDVFPDDIVFVGGHGKELNKSGLKQYHTVVRNSAMLVSEAYHKKIPLSEAKKSGMLKDYDSYGRFISFITPEYWIEALYKSLEYGNFKTL